MSFDGGAQAAAAPHVAIIAALGFERASLERHRAPASWLVVQSGPGPERAARAAARALADGARALASWGLAGALDAALEPGTVVMPRRVVMRDGSTFAADPAWHARLTALTGRFRLSYGDLLTVPAALESPQDKAAASRASGAVAVDMESAAIASVAAPAGVPFLALRVVVDALGDVLPSGVEGWIDAHGERRGGAALRAVIKPAEWRALLTLARRYRVARGVLTRLARVAATEGLLDAGPAATRDGGD